MIGVAAKPTQGAVVQEFFELFKTPWEYCRPGETYDVILATTEDLPTAHARFWVVFGPEPRPIDSQVGIRIAEHPRGRVALRSADCQFPLYGHVSTFGVEGDAVARVDSSAGIAGISVPWGETTLLRIGYDVFEEVRSLLSVGQPAQEASVPALDLHIALLRNWILEAGLSLLEIPPVPAERDFSVCLTHDIDFVGIRRHKFDHTMWGFIYRSTVGGVRDFWRRRISFGRLQRMWRAAASLPLVYAGWARDFWEPFDWYLEVEKGLPATHFLIPFKRTAGERVQGGLGARRATAYDVGDLVSRIPVLIRHGCEVAVHGIDSWHSAVMGKAELARVSSTVGEGVSGVRMHWLMQDDSTPAVLEQAGYCYDSTAGYNDAVGYLNGTTQVFRPLGATSLLELPLHVQDGALFFPTKLDLAEPEAARRCEQLIAHTRRLGGVLTVLWHDRSHGPERFWGEFYVGLIRTLKSLAPWFGTARQVVDWFRRRREVRFERSHAASPFAVSMAYEGEEIVPPLRIRAYRPIDPSQSQTDGRAPFVELHWNGRTHCDLTTLLARLDADVQPVRRTELCSAS